MYAKNIRPSATIKSRASSALKVASEARDAGRFFIVYFYKINILLLNGLIRSKTVLAFILASEKIINLLS